MKRIIILTLVSLSLFIFAFPVSAHIASTRKWSSNVVYYYANFVGQDAINRTVEAANDWNNNVPQFSFRQANPGGHVLRMSSSVPSGKLAVTYTALNFDTGYLDDADTDFSTSYTWNWSTNNPSSGQADYLTVAKHELGHWYLLWDCQDSSHSGALMYENISLGQRKSIQSHDYDPARSMY